MLINMFNSYSGLGCKRNSWSTRLWPGWVNGDPVLLTQSQNIFFSINVPDGYFTSVSVNEGDFGHLGISELLDYAVGVWLSVWMFCSLNYINNGFGLMLVAHPESGTLKLFGYIPVGVDGGVGTGW